MDEVDRNIERLNGGDRDDIYAATLSLCNVPDLAVPRLLQVLKNRSVRSIFRCRVADTLGMIGASAATEDLVLTLEDVDVRVRWSALRALAKIGDANAIPALHRLAAHDSGEFEITPTLRIVMKYEAQKAIQQIEACAAQ
jgi:HEAT repeat protein